jgi:DNA-binding NtrC family response regulator
MELFPRNPVLVVDDEKNYLASVEFELLSNGITNVECCQDSLDVMPRLQKDTYSVILLDLIMPGITGKELLPQIVALYPGIPVIVITAASPDNPEIPITQIATECMKNGAFDCLKKPFEINDLVKTIQDALSLKDSHKKIIALKESLFSDHKNKPESFFMFTTKSEKMHVVFQTIGMLAFTSRPLLIRGETGTGKDFVAQAIHELSGRKGKFISFHTTGPDDTSFEESLYGRQTETSFKGGKLEEARGGTLYIDDVGDLSKNSQEKLLHLLRIREYLPKGASEPVDADVRIITATKQNLGALMQMQTFNQDLDFLLKSHEIYIPPLRERKEDILLLLEHFVEEWAEKTGIKPPAIPEAIVKALKDYDFPGNIGELKRMVLEAVNKQRSGQLSLAVFREAIKNRTFIPAKDIKVPVKKKIIFGMELPTFPEMELLYMEEVVKRAKGDRTEAARLADLNIRVFINRLKRIKKAGKKKIAKNNKADGIDKF